MGNGKRQGHVTHTMLVRYTLVRYTTDVYVWDERNRRRLVMLQLQSSNWKFCVMYRLSLWLTALSDVHKSAPLHAMNVSLLYLQICKQYSTSR